MARRRAIAAFFVWLIANAAAGELFAVAAQPFLPLQFFYVAALLAGCAFGLAQWLALRPFFRDVRLWAPAPIVASLISWRLALMFAVGTVGFGGWLGGGFSAVVQSVLFALSARNDDLSLRLSFLWAPASLIGGAVFYFCYWGALAAGQPHNHTGLSPAEWGFEGPLRYAVAAPPCAARLPPLAAPHTPPPPPPTPPAPSAPHCPL